MSDKSPCDNCGQLAEWLPYVGGDNGATARFHGG